MGVKIKMNGGWHDITAAKYKGSNGEWVDFESVEYFMTHYDFSNILHFYHNPFSEHLTFMVQQNGTIFWEMESGAVAKTIEYRINGGSWVSITSTVEGAEIPVSSGDRVEVRGNNSAYNGSRFATYCQFSARGNIMSLINGNSFASLKTLASDNAFEGLFADCAGLADISSLILPATAATRACYKKMFLNCYNITSAPELPAATMATSCYESMFEGCGSLTGAPALPAVALQGDGYSADYCYENMFKNCTSLTVAPELPATTLSIVGCYWGMFDGCVSLTGVSTLPASSMEDSCYKRMFRGCVSMETGPVIPELDTIASSCFEEMFYGCSSLNYVKCLANTGVGKLGPGECKNWMYGVAATGTFLTSGFATGWIHGTPDGIPEGWVTRFEGAEDNNAPLTLYVLSNGNVNFKKNSTGMSNVYVNYQLNDGSWSGFNVTNTTGINIAVHTGDKLKLSTNSSGLAKSDSIYMTMSSSTAQFNAGGNVMSMVANVSGGNYGVFASAYTIPLAYALCMLFAYSTPVVNADGLMFPATALTSNAYRNMFYKNTTLTSATFDIPAVSMGNEACRGMFAECTNLKYSPTRIGTPETAMPASGCMFTFSGCTNLSSAPELPAHSVGDNGYTDMFKRCTSLTIAPELPATAVGVYSYQAMFSRCPLVKAPSVLPAMTLKKGCYSWMFEYITTLEVAPHLPALTLVNTCYDHMFTGCTALKYVSAMFTTTPGTAYTSSWLSGVSSTGTFVKNASATWTTTGAHGVPNGWTIQRLSGGTGPILWLEHRLPSSYDDDGGYESFMRGRVETPYRYGVFPFIKEGTMELDGETYYLYKNCITEDNEGYAMYALSDTEYTDVTGLNRLSCLKDINNRFKPFRYILGNDKSVQYVPGNEDVDHYFLVRT